MPFVLILAGAVLIVAAVRNTQQSLFFLLANDLTGQNNFVFWILSILVIGAIGYIPKLKPLSDGFLILVILVLFLRKGTGFFAMFNKQIATTETTTPKVSASGTTGGTQGFVGGSSGIGFSLPGIGIGVGGGGSQPGIGNGGIGSGLPGGGIGYLGCDPFFDPYCIGNDPFGGRSQV